MMKKIQFIPRYVPIKDDKPRIKSLSNEQLIKEYQIKYKIFQEIQGMIIRDNPTTFDKQQLRRARHKMIQLLRPYHEELNKRGITHDY